MEEQAKYTEPLDFSLLFVVLAILSLGLVMVFSASSELAQQDYKDSFYFLRRQLVAAGVGAVCLIIAKFIPYQYYKKLSYPLLGLSLLLLLLLYVPGLGRTVGGATRWLKTGAFSFQPSELAKLALTVYLAYSLDKKGEQVQSFTKGLVPHLAVCAVLAGLILPQPDMGMAIIIGAITVSLLFVAGAHISHLALTAAAATPILIYAIIFKSYRLGRILIFLDPWQDPLDRGFQIIHSFFAFGCGGILGAGIGDGKQKLFYLPEPHTDFILSVLAEEMGFIGICGIFVLYYLLIRKAFQIAKESSDRFGYFLAMGLGFFIGFPMLVHFGVVLGLLPTKGMALPLMSYGGTSLAVNMTAIGILLNIRGQSHRRPKK